MSLPVGIGGANPFSITADRTPLTLDESTQVENILCRNACGLSMDELIAKAINSNNNNKQDDDDDDGLGHSLGLSNKEARLLTAGVVQGQLGRILSEAARTDNVRAAIAVAQRVRQRWTSVQLAAAKALSDDDIRNIRVAMKVPWQEHVLQSSTTSAGDSGSGSGSGSGVRFGLVVFHQEKEGGGEGGRLSEYKSQIGKAIYHGLHYSVSLIKDETRNHHNNDLDPSALRGRFSTMLSNSEIPIGFRRDAFLYVDREAFHSRETARPYLWLAEPETGIGTGTGAQPEVLQPLKVDIKHIAPTLFARLVQRDLQGEARRKPYRHTSELSRLHAATDANCERDGIWPPPSRFQQL
ncbi:hypothetical protein BDV26DRAFT_299903 [Aspergillus bertholletiae]|uniref:Uncharacterized protein n=1 Tax=Aspergillus bertholletiae TaxID=1226010 RepID=A0A5N7B079_9EURO|nr:hypothetical protein BDV26DRAFT_299903 [Aspergillus bertholletiae]